jgi:hypothetical protein
MICASMTQAGNPKVEAAIAKDKDTKPATTFPADIPKLYAFFRSKGTEKGDILRGVWIAEDVGDAAPKDSKITEVLVTAERSDDYGAIGLARPIDGWPVGKYRLEIYVGDKLAEALKFTIQPGVTVELH